MLVYIVFDAEWRYYTSVDIIANGKNWLHKYRFHLLLYREQVYFMRLTQRP